MKVQNEFFNIGFLSDHAPHIDIDRIKQTRNYKIYNVYTKQKEFLGKVKKSKQYLIIPNDWYTTDKTEYSELYDLQYLEQIESEFRNRYEHLLTDELNGFTIYYGWWNIISEV